MSKGKVFGAAVLGAIVGFVSATLTAPKSGKETREDLKNVSQKVKDVVNEEAGKAKDTASKKASDLKNKTEDVADEVTDKAVELKTRAEQAIEGAKKGFAKNPNAKK